MKKFILLITLVFMTLPSIAVEECDTDCGNNWTYETVIADFNGCSYFVTFGYQECPTLKREVKIFDIATYSTCPYSSNRILLMELALKKVLNMAHSLFPSMTPLSNDVTVYTNCCWKSATSSGETHWQPCITTCCCETEVSIKDSTRPGGGKIYTLEDKTVISDGSSYDCTKDILGGSTGCLEMCSAMDNIDIGENLESTTFQCTDTCSSEWSYASPIKLSTDCLPSCLEYSKRECGGKTQIRFSSFTYNQTTPTPCSSEDVMKNAIKEILKREAAIASSLPKTIEINLPTCFKFVSYNYAEVCYWDDNCCLVSYEISGTDPNVYASDYVLDTLVGFVNCGLDLNCEFVCDDDYVYWSPYDPLPKQFNPLIEENIFETNTLVYPNPTKNSITFEINSKFTIDLELVIYNELGKEVDRVKLENHNGNLKYIYDSKQLSKGVYLFKIIAGINAVDSGKFIKE